MTYGTHDITTTIAADAGGFVVGQLTALVMETTTRASIYIDRRSQRYAVQIPAHLGGAVLRDIVTALDQEGFLE